MLRCGERVAGVWLVEALVGDGAAADVYRVRHAISGDLRALKRLREPTREARSRLEREARGLAAVDHPHVLGVHDVLEVEGSTCLLLEWVAGPSLFEWLRGRTVSVSEALSLFAGVVAGVGAAHKLGLIHRDLKPSNVMLAPDGAGGWTPKVCDFGLVKELGLPGDTRTGIAMGTPAYMAPEQIRSAKRADQRADIFSLGVILYELLCGRPPFVGDDLLKNLQDAEGRRYPAPRVMCPDLSVSTALAIDGALLPDCEARIPDCSTLLAVLAGELGWELPALPVGAAVTLDLEVSCRPLASQASLSSQASLALARTSLAPDATLATREALASLPAWAEQVLRQCVALEDGFTLAIAERVIVMPAQVGDLWLEDALELFHEKGLLHVTPMLDGELRFKVLMPSP